LYFLARRKITDAFFLREVKFLEIFDEDFCGRNFPRGESTVERIFQGRFSKGNFTREGERDFLS